MTPNDTTPDADDPSRAPVAGEQLVVVSRRHFDPDRLERVTVERTTPSGQIILSNGTRWRAWNSLGYSTSSKDIGTLRREKPGEWDAWVAYCRRSTLLAAVRHADYHALPTPALEQIAAIIKTCQPQEAR